MDKLFHLYHTKSLDQSKELLLKLEDWSKKIGGYDPDKPDIANLWYCVYHLRRAVEEMQANKFFADTNIEKTALRMVDGEFVNEVVQKLTDLESSLNTAAGTQNTSPQPSSEKEDNLQFLSLNRQTHDLWQRAYLGLEAQKRNQLNQVIRDLRAAYNSLLWQLQLIVVVVGAPGPINVYSALQIGVSLFEEELDKPIEGEMRPIRYVQTLKDAKFGDSDGADIVLHLTQFVLSENAVKLDALEWEDALYLTLMLDAIFYRFDSLSNLYKELILRKYFLAAIAADIPVKKILQDILKYTQNVVSYINLNSLFYDSLVNSDETIPLDVQSGTGQPLSQVFNKFVANSGDGLLDGLTQEQFVNGLYQDQSGRGDFVKWSLEAVSIFANLKEATLINWEKDRYRNPQELWFQDVAQLLVSFTYGDEYKSIIDYFKAENPRVAMLGFLEKLRDTVDIKDEQVFDLVMGLSEVLQNNGLIGEEDDLLEFHEEDGEFHWNTNLLGAPRIVVSSKPNQPSAQPKVQDSQTKTAQVNPPAKQRRKAPPSAARKSNKKPNKPVIKKPTDKK